eukprot:GEMP01044239.1.p1 GENE.GEMP01044239.1~~GEMP01044239.1.p1  ORF type:complete len:428 (+),score=126.98 GEMP01044239.1:399-1682(+)
MTEKLLYLSDVKEGLENYVAKVDHLLEMHHKRNVQQWEVERGAVQRRNKELETHLRESTNTIVQKYTSYLNIMRKNVDEYEISCNAEHEKRVALQQQVFEAERQWHEIEKLNYEGELTTTAHAFLKKQQTVEEAMQDSHMNTKLAHAQYNLRLQGQKTPAFVETASYIEEFAMQNFLAAWNREEVNIEQFLSSLLVTFKERLCVIKRTVIANLTRLNECAAKYRAHVLSLNATLGAHLDQCDTEVATCFNTLTEAFTQQLSCAMNEHERFGSYAEDLVATKEQQVKNERVRSLGRLRRKRKTWAKWAYDYREKASSEYVKDLEENEAKWFDQRIAEMTAQKKINTDVPAAPPTQLRRYHEQLVRLWDALEIPDKERRKFLLAVEEQIPASRPICSAYESHIGHVSAMHLVDWRKMHPNPRTGMGTFA